MAYDPNWLQKERARHWARQERELSHMHTFAGVMLCGKGSFSGIRIVQFPSLANLPGCRTCRERYLASIGFTDINPETGYPNTQIS